GGMGRNDSASMAALGRSQKGICGEGAGKVSSPGSATPAERSRDAAPSRRYSAGGADGGKSSNRSPARANAGRQSASPTAIRRTRLRRRRISPATLTILGASEVLRVSASDVLRVSAVVDRSAVWTVPLLGVQIVAPPERRERDAEEGEDLVEEESPPLRLGDADGGEDLREVDPELEADEPLPIGELRDEVVALRLIGHGHQEVPRDSGLELPAPRESRDLEVGRVDLLPVV